MRIILASKSPRRLELLTKAGISCEVIPSGFEEKTVSTDPEKKAIELASGKAGLVFHKAVGASLKRVRTGGEFPIRTHYGGAILQSSEAEKIAVIGADTIAVCDGQILGKPEDREAARAGLKLLQGRKHEVITGVCLVWGDGRSNKIKKFAERTIVEVYPMTDEQIDRYIDTGEPFDKAGGYGIQGAFEVWVKGICGDYCNVVGLPIAHLYQEMLHAGLIK